MVVLPVMLVLTVQLVRIFSLLFNYQHTILLPTALCTTTIGHFSVPETLSCENEVFLHDNKKSFLYQWLST